MEETKEILTYKGLPLARCGDTVYYGNPTDKYIIMLQVTDKAKCKDITLAKKITVMLQLTDPDIKLTDRIIKKSEKSNFYAAMDIADIWLTRAKNGKI
ncbi:MAG: hypothetical protein IKA51_00830 [Clostridia bacterium]|nr:hypothetical protein [Clostridia bacterium]